MALIENIRSVSAPCDTARSSISLRRIYAVWRTRRALAALDDAALRDIGVSHRDAHAEANRPLWDVPRNWRC